MNTPNSFGTVSKLMHWLIALLVVIMLIAGYFMDDITNDALRASVVNVHKLTGITVLFLMVLRLGWALGNPKPELPLGTPWAERAAEWAGQGVLYALIIAQPLTGWMGSVAGGHIPHLGPLQLSLPLLHNKIFAKTCFHWHNTLAIVIIVVVSLHVLAALYHHFVRRDNTLMRMLPGTPDGRYRKKPPFSKRNG